MNMGSPTPNYRSGYTTAAATEEVGQQAAKHHGH